jgi:hypothetical protein
MKFSMRCKDVNLWSQKYIIQHGKLKDKFKNKLKKFKDNCIRIKNNKDNKVKEVRRKIEIGI